jgi:heme/copper-type cytochrome/quinol oxidase subunit 3
MVAESLAVPRRVVHRSRDHAPAVSNARIAMAVLIMAETMLFAGLVGMFIVFRLSAPQWPPANQPRLPLGLTTFNSLVLLASALPLTRTLRAIRRDDVRAAIRGLATTLVLGAAFLTIQGVEWTRLVHFGLTLSSGPYGGSFYVLIGCHALHVLAAAGWLAVVTLLARWRRFTAGAHAGLEMCAIYWYFVCALWVLLFLLVYVP